MATRGSHTASHWNADLLLTHLAHLAVLHLLESVVLVDLKILHLSLQLFVLGRKLLLLRDHAHVDILLVGSGDLLLLCLQHLNLLSELELLHHQRRHFGRAATVGNVQATAGRALGTGLVLLIHWIGVRECTGT